MPSAQVIDFGPSPGSEAAGNFGKSFGDAFFKQKTQQRNDDIFRKIKDKYGPDASPDRIYKDVIEAEGLDQDYKTDILKNVKDYANLSAKKGLTPYQSAMLDIKKDDLKIKKDKLNVKEVEKPITAYQQKLITQRAAALDLQRQRIKQASEKQDSNFPKLISDYSNNLLKDSDNKISTGDKSILNSRIRSNIEDDGMGIDEAFNEAFEYISLKNEVVDEAKITPKPTGWFGGTGSQLEVGQAMDKAYEELEQFYEAGITSQKDLRSIASKGGWEPQEITSMLQKVFQRNGKKLKTKSPEQSAKIPSEEQGVTSEDSSLDDILFGE